MTKLEVLSIILECQKMCAPVKVSIGWTNKDNQVKSNYIVVHEAPPKVIKELMNTKDLFPSLVEGEGLLIICKE